MMDLINSKYYIQKIKLMNTKLNHYGLKIHRL